MGSTNASGTGVTVVNLNWLQTCSFRSAKGQTSLLQIKQKKLVRMTNTNNLPNPNQDSSSSCHNFQLCLACLLNAFTERTSSRTPLFPPVALRPGVARMQRSPCNSYSGKTVGKPRQCCIFASSKMQYSSVF